MPFFVKNNIKYDSNNFYLRHRQGKNGLDNPAFMDEHNRGKLRVFFSLLKHFFQYDIKSRVQ
jgi:hypothetical protein